MGARFRREFERFYKRISSDIYQFCAELNFEPTWQQKQLFDALNAGKRRIAVKSGQGPGKTTASSVAGMWRAIRNERSRLVVTAPTMRQCKDVWLAEVRNILGRANPGIRRMFQPTLTNLGICGHHATDWGALLITATKAENAQGQHRENMDIICEEASGVSRENIEQYKGTLSNPDAFFLQIGNPNTRDCSFFDCFHSLNHIWTTFTWNAEETPASKWFDPGRNKEVEEEFGRDSDVYRVRVLGEFPHTDPKCVIDYESCDACMQPEMMETAMRVLGRDGRPIRQIGIDLARFGGDESVIMMRSGNAIMDWTFRTHTEPADTIREAFEWQKDWGWRDDACWYVCDAGGMGQGAMHLFYDHQKQIHEFHNNGLAHDQSRYANKITEAWFELRRLLRERKVYLPRDNQLLQQLTTRQYYTDKKGRLILETKDDYIKRGNHSPDRADALVMAMYNNVAVSQAATAA